MKQNLNLNPVPDHPRVSIITPVYNGFRYLEKCIQSVLEQDYPYLEELSKKNTEKYGLKMNFQYRAQEKPTGGSDYTAFTNKGVPIIAVMAAMHPEYHTPIDHISLVNWDKMLEIIKLGFLNMWEIANSDF